MKFQLKFQNNSYNRGWIRLLNLIMHVQFFHRVFHVSIYIDIVAVVMFKSATLRCPTNSEATELINWRFVKLGTEDEEVVYSNSRVFDAFNDSIYANRTKDGRHELFIPNTTWRNAGDYFCLDWMENRIVELIVLGEGLLYATVMSLHLL